MAINLTAMFLSGHRNSNISHWILGVLLGVFQYGYFALYGKEKLGELLQRKKVILIENLDLLRDFIQTQKRDEWIAQLGPLPSEDEVPERTLPVTEAEKAKQKLYNELRKADVLVAVRYDRGAVPATGI